MAGIDHIPKAFDPIEVDDRIYQNWEDKGYFRARVNPDKQAYTIVMPPPNITGQLHMGHALNNSLQDIIIRWKRMQGFEALWQPGTDHAAIATEAKIVEALKAKGTSKEELGREKFLEAAWDWREEYGKLIVEQLKKIGSSCDWERERFTMDEGLSQAVREVFIRLYEKGLIYRGKKMVNWCSHCLTTISDAEVEYEEQASQLWHIRYPYADGSGHIVVATTRPETMLGDTAVAVHPDDERYLQRVGQSVILPLMGKEIPVIADPYVEMDFGTGVVKITPAHDPNDYEVGLRHQLPIVDVMTDDAYINENGGVYAGLSAREARRRIVADLEEQGFMEKIEAYHHNVGTCYRCHNTIDPKLSLQWFVRMKELAEPAIRAVERGETVFVPERFDKIYFNWMHNIKDWCISRQLWWGHRIPAYHCKACGELIVSRAVPALCPRCGGGALHEDEDTLDTWFSSALWPFSTLGWPEKTEDLAYFFPTQTLVTGYDIIFFWVARMIFSSIEQMGEVPFKTVYFNGIVRDAQGRKMSKSLNNGIDPLEIIEKYGADALRFSLLDGNAAGNDQRFRDDKLEAGRAFINKVWNAFRFVMQNLDEDLDSKTLPLLPRRLEDRWILSRLKKMTEEVTQNLEKFEFGVALAKIYSFIWEEYCDWYIEMVKPRLRDKTHPDNQQAQLILLYVLNAALHLLHPFMPFFTEEIHSFLPDRKEASIMISSWPDPSVLHGDSRAESDMATLMDVIRQIRNIRLKLNVPPAKRFPMILVTEDQELAQLFMTGQDYMERLAGIDKVVLQKDREGIPDNAASIAAVGGSIYILLADLVDLQQEKLRLRKELEQIQQMLQRLETKLANKGFTEKAPAQVVAAEKERLEKQRQLAGQLEERLRGLENGETGSGFAPK